MPTKKPSLVGKTFRAAYADSNSLWEVKRKRGRGVYECTIVNEPITIDGKTFDGDYAGTTKVFTAEDVERSIRMAEFCRSLMNEHEAFYESLQVGAIVHYAHGFGEFVRCEVVELTEETLIGFHRDPVGTKVLKPLALVGGWRSYDLKSESYHPKQIRDGKLMKPNASNIYENPKAEIRGTDPRQMPVLSFEGQTELFASA
jgi:hypothetical protein